MSSSYDDIINLPHPISTAHPQMSKHDRAAQFSPFAALTGYDAAVAETGRLTAEKAKLTEDEKEAISQRLQMIQEHIAEYPEVTITYFLQDKKKSGGAYKSVTGAVRKINEYERMIMLYNQESIPTDDILQISGELFKDMEGFV